jgi:predicted methyltransferase
MKISANKVAESRPAQDYSLRQVPMTPESMVRQNDLLAGGGILDDKRVFFLGDADHQSVLLAQECGVIPVILEYDERVIESLERWFDKLNIDCDIRKYDAREPVVAQNKELKKCNGFYINPPYSHLEHNGPRVWLQRVMEIIEKDSVGVLILLWDGGAVNRGWVYDMQRCVLDYLSQNSFEILDIHHNVHDYDGASDAGLKSSNIILKWSGCDVDNTIRYSGCEIYK